MSNSEPTSPQASDKGKVTLRLLARWFLAGLFAIIPMGATLWVLALLYIILRRIGDEIIDAFMRLINGMRGLLGFDKNLYFEFIGADLIRFALPVGLILLVGAAVANTPGRSALAFLDGRMTRLPLIGIIYSAVKQFVDAVRNLGGERKFKSVAYIEYPTTGSRLIGFVTSNFRDHQTGRDVTALFVPTSPNPMTGFTVIVDNEKVIDSQMTLEEASKMILSAGLVAPAQFTREMGHLSAKSQPPANHSPSKSEPSSYPPDNLQG